MDYFTTESYSYRLFLSAKHAILIHPQHIEKLRVLYGSCSFYHCEIYREFSGSMLVKMKDSSEMSEMLVQHHPVEDKLASTCKY